jgi:signal transduction histidine kinase
MNRQPPRTPAAGSAPPAPTMPVGVPGLRTLLIGLIVALLVAAVVAVSWAARATFLRLGEETAEQRLELAAVRAQALVLDQADELARSARLLAERPTLRRFVLDGDPALDSFLARFAETGGLAFAAVLAPAATQTEPSGATAPRRWHVLGAGGPRDPGALGLRRIPAGGQPAPTPSRADGSLPDLFAGDFAGEAASWDRQLVAVGDDWLLLAFAPLNEDGGRRAVVARTLDRTWLDDLTATVGAEVKLRPRGRAEERPTGPDPWHPGTQQALPSAHPAALTLGRPLSLGAHRLSPAEKGRDAVPASEPGAPVDAELASASGGPVPASPADLVITLPPGAAQEGLAAFTTRLRRLALGIALLAGILALAAGEAIARPVAALTAAATRIGRGDLATPVAAPAASAGRDLALLAVEMDGMRRRLRQTQSSLAEREAESRAILGGIAEGVFAVDRDRRVSFLNPQAGALLGITPEAALGRFCGDVLGPRRADGTRPCEDDCPILHARSRGTARAIEHLERAGTRRTVVITSAPPAPAAEDDAGVPSGRQIQLLRDETAEEAETRLRETVLAHLSHELETPLAAQLASLELLRDRLTATEGEATTAAGSVHRDSLALVGALERGTQRLAQLVHNLLERARIEAGEASIRHQPVALDAVVEAAVEAVRPLLVQRRQTLDVELPYPLPMIVGDAPRLTQVFVNLLANANKFAPEGSAVRIAGAVGRDHVELWVEDEGPGLPPALAEAVFRPFVRLPGRGPGEGGIGLGLAIVDSIVRRHGGRVRVESPPPSRGPALEPTPPGTRVTVWLPRPEEAA